VIALLYLVASALLLWGAGSQRRESSADQIAHETRVAGTEPAPAEDSA
jgi:hypothetical protein